VKNSNLESIAFRLDPEYYQPDNLRLYNKLSHIEYKKISEIAFVTDGIHESISFDENSKILLISAKSPKENYFETTGLSYISKEQDMKNPRTRLRIDDIIISSVGTIGNCAVVDDSILPANSDRHVGIIRIQNQKYKPRFISAFLLSKYGRFQTLREATGNVQLNLFIYKINEIIFPDFTEGFQTKIENACFTANKYRHTIQNSYHQAQTLLLSELGLLNWKPEHHLSFVKNYSDTQQAERFDAEYFQPKYDEIVGALLTRFNAKPIGDYDFFDITTGQYCPQYVPEGEGKPYLRGTDLSEGSVNIDHLVYIPAKEQFEDKKANEGDAVVTRVGTIGLSARIPKECNGGTISDNLIRIRILTEEKINSYYLSCFLGSVIGKTLMLRNGRGSVQQRLNQETLKEILLPLLPMSKQHQIQQKIIESFNLRKQSKHLLECAKRAVEIAIEEDEETAEKWLKEEMGVIN
jgi:restriction endonuclease S subunit